MENNPFYLINSVSDVHFEYLDQDYFPVVGKVRRFPRYVNKRCIDPQVKMYNTQTHEKLTEAWDIPVPNELAAYKSLAKYAKNTPYMSLEHVCFMNQAFDWADRHFGLYMRESRVMTQEEVIQRIDKSTSSGFPFNTLHKTKKEVFDKDPNIREWLERDWVALAEDPLWSSPYTNSLKEELRTQEKIVNNSIRTFSAGPMDTTIHGSRLFLDMNDKFIASHLQSSSAVGMTPLKGGWKRLIDKLNIFKNGYALDESAYDASLRSHLLWGCARLRWSWLRQEDRTPENLRRILTFYRNVVNTLIICPDGTIVYKKGGQPSGAVNTISDNTIILYVLMAYAWIANAPENQRTYLAFEDNTAKALNGDDNTWTVSDQAHLFFNGKSVIKVWEKIGIITTTDSLEPRQAIDLDFLSGRTVFLNGIPVPLYDREKLMKSLLYVPRAKMHPATTLLRAGALLQIGWSDYQFRSYTRKFINWLLQHYDRVLCNTPDWIVAKSNVLTDTNLRKLWLGNEVYLEPQSYCESKERLISTVKELVMPRQANAQATATTKKVKKLQKEINQVKQQQKRRKPRKRNRKVSQNAPKGASKPKVIQTLDAITILETQQGKPYTKTFGGKTSKCHFIHSEVLGTVSAPDGTNKFPLQFNLDCNPGDSTSGMQLALEAKRWEFYHCVWKRYRYVHSAAQTISGSVVMGFDYDINDQAPETLLELQGYHGTIQGAVHANHSFVIDAKLANGKFGSGGKYKKVRGYVPNAHFDQTLYDEGSFYLTATASASPSLTYPFECGTLWVDYHYIFVNPVPDRPVPTPVAPFASFYTATNVTVPANTTVQMPLATINNLLQGIVDVDLPSGTMTAKKPIVAEVSFQPTIFGQSPTNNVSLNPMLKTVIDGLNTFSQLGRFSAISPADPASANFSQILQMKPGDAFQFLMKNETANAGNVAGGAEQSAVTIKVLNDLFKAIS